MLGRYDDFPRNAAFDRAKSIGHRLGHIVFDLPSDLTFAQDDLAHSKTLDESGIFPREGYRLPPFHPDARVSAAPVAR